MSTTRPTLFETECQTAVSAVRASIIDLYGSINADPVNPQEVARHLGLNKTLTWNIARIVQADDDLDAASHIPGLTSLKRLFEAARKHGAPDLAIDRLRDAIRRFDNVISVHVGDRASLELMLDSMGRQRSESLELSRKLAFRGLSGIYGVQASTHLMCWLAAPNAENPGRVDLVSLKGYTGYRRLRPDVRWPIFLRRGWGSLSDPDGPHTFEPLAPEQSNGDSLLHQFFRGEPPVIESRRIGDAHVSMLQPGGVGKTGAFDCFQGAVMRAGVPREHDPNDPASDDIGEIGVTITTPAESLLFDLIVHRDLAYMLEGDVHVHAQYLATGASTAEPMSDIYLPIKPKASKISGAPPAVATPLIPQYADIVRFTGDRLGWDLTDFLAARVRLDYPPLGSMVLQRFNLPRKR